MISREESYTKMQSILDDIHINDFTVGDINSVISEIYDSMGMCEQCKHYIEMNESSGLCDNTRLPEIGVDADFFCRLFEKETT